MVFGLLQALQYATVCHTETELDPKLNRILTSPLVVALAFAGGATLAQAEQSWNETDQSLDSMLHLEPSGLLFALDGADLGVFQIAVEEGDSDVVAYDLNEGKLSFATGMFGGSYDQPLFCFDFANETPPVGLTLTDANGHVIADRISLGSGLEYFLPTDELFKLPAPTVQCFYRGQSMGEFGLYGVAPVGDGPIDEVFASRFEFVPPPGSIEIVYDHEDFVGEGNINYDVSLVNTGTVDLDGVAFQEVFPRNSVLFDASLNNGFWQCASVEGAVCPDSDGDGPLRFDGLTLPAGSSLTFSVTRLVRNGSAPGQIDLYAGAVAGPGPDAAFDAVHRNLIVVGEGEALAATNASAEVGENANITVTALDGEGGQVPNIEVTVSDDDGLQVTPTSATTDASGEAHFTATTTVADDYQLLFSAEDLEPGVSQVSFSAAGPSEIHAQTLNNDAVADGQDQVVFEVDVVDGYQNPVTGALVEVIDAGGLADLDGAEAVTVNGTAEFAASSETADTYTVVFAVDSVGSAEVSASFVAGDVAGFEFVQQPEDGTVGQPLNPVVVRVVDANGNWVEDDDETLVEVYLRQDGVGGQDYLAAGTANGGQVGFEGLVVDEPGENWFLRVQDEAGTLSSEDSTFFNVDADKAG